MVHRRKKRERDKGALEPKAERPLWSKPELPGEGLLELEDTETMPAELVTMPAELETTLAELETSERSQELFTGYSA